MSERREPSALTLAARLRAGNMSASELVAHHLDVIAKKNPELAAFASIIDLPRARACPLDRPETEPDPAFARSGKWPAFFGVPNRAQG